GQPHEAARLLRAAAAQLDALGEHALARIARDQAAATERTGRLPALATKELTYATRRLGGET
ncbi:MAG TPA: VWA domain-containing protein, partial [Roseiflexaceae bacterium]|nr:VWA domain-containing protein [Roseiflexaceae bacterium]